MNRPINITIARVVESFISGDGDLILANTPCAVIRLIPDTLTAEILTADYAYSAPEYSRISTGSAINMGTHADVSIRNLRWECAYDSHRIHPDIDIDRLIKDHEESLR